MKVILIILAIIALSIGLALYFTSGLTDAAKAQLTTIRSGDLNAAYTMTSHAFQQQTSETQFVEYVNRYPILKNNKDVTFSERKVENGTGYLLGTLEGNDGSKMKIEYQLVKENGIWKIQAMSLSTAGVNKSSSPE